MRVFFCSLISLSLSLIPGCYIDVDKDLIGPTGDQTASCKEDGYMVTGPEMGLLFVMQGQGDTQGLDPAAVNRNQGKKR